MRLLVRNHVADKRLAVRHEKDKIHPVDFDNARDRRLRIPSAIHCASRIYLPPNIYDATIAHGPVAIRSGA